MTRERPDGPSGPTPERRTPGEACAELTDSQRRLLIRMWSRPVVLTGEESDEMRLAVLQLYTVGLITQVGGRRNARAIEWRLTDEGRSCVESLR
ncbi:hypothetical protein [Methylobacterium sp. A54F]|jgi:hypothetical protein